MNEKKNLNLFNNKETKQKKIKNLNLFNNKKTKQKKTKNLNLFNKKKKFRNYNEFKKYKKLKLLEKKASKIPKITNYLHSNKKLKQGIFLKKPTFNEIKYPISFNFKLINEYIRKK